MLDKSVNAFSCWEIEGDTLEEGTEILLVKPLLNITHISRFHGLAHLHRKLWVCSPVEGSRLKPITLPLDDSLKPEQSWEGREV